MSSFFAGVVAGVAGLSAVSFAVNVVNEKDITGKAQQYAGSAAELNKLFGVTGKGLVAVTINGKFCVIDAPKGLKGRKLNYMACVP